VCVTPPSVNQTKIRAQCHTHDISSLHTGFFLCFLFQYRCWDCFCNRKGGFDIFLYSTALQLTTNVHSTRLVGSRHHLFLRVLMVEECALGRLCNARDTYFRNCWGGWLLCPPQVLMRLVLTRPSFHQVVLYRCRVLPVPPGGSQSYNGGLASCT